MTHLPPRASRPGYEASPPSAEGGSTSGLAIASLVCGIVSYVCILGPLAAFPAVITGHIALGQIRRSGRTLGGRGMALAGVILGWAVIGITVLLFVGALVYLMVAAPSAEMVRQEARVLGMAQEVQCVNNLKQIHFGCQMYAAEHDGRLPDRPSQLYPDYVGDLRVFVCPRTDDMIGSKGEIDLGTSYVYPAAGKSLQRLRPDDVIAADKPGNHPGQNVFHVLYMDGHVVEEPAELHELIETPGPPGR